MSKLDMPNPFHAGELQAQARAGAGNVAKWAGGFIRNYLPQQHREFHQSLPFFIVAGGDAEGRLWATLVEGQDGFIGVPDRRRITLDTSLDAADPLAASFRSGADIGVLGIELSTRRRNRFSGAVRPEAAGYVIDIRQTFGNCPQYIHARDWRRVDPQPPAAAERRTALSAAQIAKIAAADTMFIGSGNPGNPGDPASGYDASHRGGAPGFVHVMDATHLQIPDYAGNNFFNTIGNLITDPRIGLLFVDFETGGLLHISGRASVDWEPRERRDPDAWRLINVEIDAVLERSGAVSLRWARQDQGARQLLLAKREREAADITSFYFIAADGYRLDPFEPGQHLPVALQIPGRAEGVTRSYSLSGPPSETNYYRISVKREEAGFVSRVLHDSLPEGAVIHAQKPSGDFTIPCSNCPLVFVSAGIGVTPVLSMLHAVAEETRPIWFIHGARKGEDHAFGAELNELRAQNPNIQSRVFYSQPEASDEAGAQYDIRGRITAAHLRDLDAGPDAHYMLCGPAQFLADIRTGLEASGVPADQIHFETFGPSA